MQLHACRPYGLSLIFTPGCRSRRGKAHLHISLDSTKLLTRALINYPAKASFFPRPSAWAALTRPILLWRFEKCPVRFIGDEVRLKSCLSANRGANGIHMFRDIFVNGTFRDCYRDYNYCCGDKITMTEVARFCAPTRKFARLENIDQVELHFR